MHQQSQATRSGHAQLRECRWLLPLGARPDELQRLVCSGDGLPYTEQRNLYNSLNFIWGSALPNGTHFPDPIFHTGADHHEGINATVFATQLDLFNCPSDARDAYTYSTSDASTGSGILTPPHFNYMACSGSIPLDDWQAFGNNCLCDGIFCHVDGGPGPYETVNGPPTGFVVKIASVTDGTSNTCRVERADPRRRLHALHSGIGGMGPDASDDQRVLHPRPHAGGTPGDIPIVYANCLSAPITRTRPASRGPRGT